MGNVTIGGQVYTVRVVDAIRIDGEAVDFVIHHADREVISTITDQLELLLALCDELGYRRVPLPVPVLGRVD